jgi:hypothetical protein
VNPDFTPAPAIQSVKAPGLWSRPFSAISCPPRFSRIGVLPNVARETHHLVREDIGGEKGEKKKGKRFANHIEGRVTAENGGPIRAIAGKFPT